MYHNSASQCSLCEGKEGAKGIYISMCFVYYRICSQHAADYLYDTNSHFSVAFRRKRSWASEVGQFWLEQGRYYCIKFLTVTSAVKSSTCLYISFLVPLTNCLSIERIRLYVRVMEWFIDIRFCSGEISQLCSNYIIKRSRNMPGVDQRVPAVLGSQIPWHSVQEFGEVVSLGQRPPLPPGNVPDTHFH